MTVRSPDCRDTLCLAFENPDWTGSTIDVAIDAVHTPSGSDVGSSDARTGSASLVNFDVTLTSFDFPFTDSTLLADGNRFSLFIYSNAKPPECAMRVRLRWFPKDYFPPRERPTDYGKFHDDLPLPRLGGSRD